MLAAWGGHQNIALWLLRYGADVNIQDKVLNPHLTLAVTLTLTVTPNPIFPPRQCQWTALMWAARHGHCNIVRALLAYRANPSLQREVRACK